MRTRRRGPLEKCPADIDRVAVGIRSGRSDGKILIGLHRLRGRYADLWQGRSGCRSFRKVECGSAFDLVAAVVDPHEDVLIDVSTDDSRNGESHGRCIATVQNEWEIGGITSRSGLRSDAPRGRHSISVGIRTTTHTQPTRRSPGDPVVRSGLRIARPAAEREDRRQVHSSNGKNDRLRRDLWRICRLDIEIARRNLHFELTGKEGLGGRLIDGIRCPCFVPPQSEVDIGSTRVNRGQLGKVSGRNRIRAVHSVRLRND